MWRIFVLYHISLRRRDKSLGFLISRKIHRKNGRVWLDKRKHMRRMDNRRWNGAQICSGWKTHGRPIGSHVQNALLQRHFGIDDFSGSLAVVRAVGFMRYIYFRVIRPVGFMRYGCRNFGTFRSCAPLRSCGVAVRSSSVSSSSESIFTSPDAIALILHEPS